MPSRRLPKLRPVESLVVPDARYGRTLVLRDPQGIATGAVQIPPALVPVVARFDGTASCSGSATIVPILAGLGPSQSSGQSPQTVTDVAHFLDSIHELTIELGPRLVLVAGVDLAHVGPRFGDPAPADEEARARLERTDRESMQLFADRERESFWEQVSSDLDTRRVCGLAPMYSLLWSLGAGPRGELVHYEQTIDPDDGSIVSHTAMTFSC